MGLLPADGNFTTANAAASVLIVRRLPREPSLIIGTTLLGSYGRLFLGAFMPVVESVAPDLGDCNHGGVACLGVSFAEKGNALDPAEEIVSLSPPGRVALILNTEVAPYEAGTKFTFRPNSGS